MRILIVAATAFEIDPVLAALNFKAGENTYKHHTVFVLITGVGMVATAFALGAQLARSTYDLALNIGIAGSFDRQLALGEVVHITKDRFAELGAEDDREFITIDELGFGTQVQTPLTEFQHPRLKALKQVNAITVNTVHGNELSIAAATARFNPQIESMEGAAFFYACNKAALPCLQVRTISNYVERRNRGNWNIAQAVKNLNIFAKEFIDELPF